MGYIQSYLPPSDFVLVSLTRVVCCKVTYRLAELLYSYRDVVTHDPTGEGCRVVPCVNVRHPVSTIRYFLISRSIRGFLYEHALVSAMLDVGILKSEILCLRMLDRMKKCPLEYRRD